MYIFLAFSRTRTSFVGGHRGVVVVGVAMAPSRSRRLREPAGTSATGDARDY